MRVKKQIEKLSVGVVYAKLEPLSNLTKETDRRIYCLNFALNPIPKRNKRNKHLTSFRIFIVFSV